MALSDSILEYMNEKAYKPMTISELFKAFNVKKSQHGEFQKVVSYMEKEALIVRTRNDHYGVPERMGLIIGKLQGNAKGYGFVNRGNDMPDIFVPGNAMNGAMNGDKVLVKIVREENFGKKCEGEILNIIDHSNTRIVGTYEDSKSFGFVIADDKRISQDIFIPKSERNGAKSGQIVMVEVTEWPGNKRNPEGKITEILGEIGDKGIDILTVIKKYNLPEEFPDKVEKYAENISEEIPKVEYEHREDLRNLKIVTIDGEDAKDLDDAVSLEILPNGNYKLGVHIADVSNYVKEKNPLDKEALKRGTSVYLIDRVIPMLPKKLSNGICSLNPKIDRLTLSCFMEIDKDGKVVDHRIFESIIKTSERMTYTDVTKILRDKDEDTIKRYEYLVENFQNMEKLCEILYKKRILRGAIDFDFTECKVILNDMGKAIAIEPYERGISNRIVEEFMLVCNETVAEHMFWSKVPFVYRIHENPNEEKLLQFNEFIHNLGYFITMSREIHPKVLQEVVEQVRGKDEETVVNTLLLRSMMKAKYSPDCTGHFGLAARYYCHFTSPIRRYPDLIIHRIIKEYIHGSIDEKRSSRLTSEVEYASQQSSDTERVAQEAEREVDDLKKAEFMSDKLEQEFDGIISSVTSFGLFVELPNTVEGLVHISSLADDYYIYDERHLCLIGERLKKVYKLGDKVSVKVIKVDMESYEIYFDLAKKDNQEENLEADEVDSDPIISIKDLSLENVYSNDIDIDLLKKI